MLSPLRHPCNLFLKKICLVQIDNFQLHFHSDYRYYLNKERCETGGIRAIAAWLDPAPTVLRVNVLAVDPGCQTVYYHNKKAQMWSSYEESMVSHITCTNP